MIVSTTLRRWSIGLIASMIASLPAHASCGRTTVGEMNWPSGQFLASTVRFVLEAAFGCKVDLVQTATVPGITSMVQRGLPDVTPELWLNSVKAISDQGISERVIIDMGDIFEGGGVEAWWIPRYVAAAHPQIKTVADLTENARLFADPEVPGKGRFYTCPPGWACQIVNRNLFRAFGLEQRFTLFDPGSGEALTASLARAYERREPWVGFYWAPSAALGRYDMVRIDMGPADFSGHVCNSDPNCGLPFGGAYPPSRVAKVVTTRFAQASPEAAAFVRRMSLPHAVVNEVLAWGDANAANGDEIARHFLTTHGAVWRAWLNEDAARQVSAALDRARRR